jgi:hypothetical protein
MIKEYKIPDIIFPKEFIPSIKNLKKYIRIEKHDGLNLNLLSISTKNMPTNIHLHYLLFSWIAALNCIVENLNLILSDLNRLKGHSNLSPNSARVRYFLLIRTYFYEFFRIKEISNVYLKKFKQIRLIEKELIKTIKNDFHNIFKEVLVIRNNFIHKQVSPYGEDLEFHYAASINECGFKIVDKKSGEETRWQDLLNKITKNNLEGLQFEGERMIIIMQKLIDYFSVLIKVDQGDLETLKELESKFKLDFKKMFEVRRT